MDDILLLFPTYIALNFELQNNANQTIAIKEKVNLQDHGSTGGFNPTTEQKVTSNGGKGNFSVTS